MFFQYVSKARAMAYGSFLIVHMLMLQRDVAVDAKLFLKRTKAPQLRNRAREDLAPAQQRRPATFPDRDRPLRDGA